MRLFGKLGVGEGSVFRVWGVAGWGFRDLGFQAVSNILIRVHGFAVLRLRF